MTLCMWRWFCMWWEARELTIGVIIESARKQKARAVAGLME
jgi:hypothetical protein